MKEYIDELCRITSEVQARLAQKRRALCLSYRDLGKFFRVDWSTFRKWETASVPCVRCRHYHRDMLNRYLNGEFDQQLLMGQRAGEEPVAGWRLLPPQLHQCMENITDTYELCQMRPELRSRLLDGVEEATREAPRDFCRLP